MRACFSTCHIVGSDYAFYHQSEDVFVNVKDCLRVHSRTAFRRRLALTWGLITRSDRMYI